MYIRITSIMITIITVVVLLPFTTSANPSSYWCSKHKQIGCTHCLSHSVINVSSTTATCTYGGGQIRACTTSNCDSIFFQTAPLGHQYNTSGRAQYICNRSASCGYLSNTTSGKFEYYMYRTTSLTGTYRANLMSNDSSAPHHSGNRGIDIVTGVNASQINGYPIYVQGTGTVKAVGDNPNSSTGYYVDIEYPNGWRVRYLHLKQQSDLIVNSNVNTSYLIGLTGNTGAGITDYHLHQDIKINGNIAYADTVLYTRNPDTFS